MRGSAWPMVIVHDVDCGWTKQLQHVRIARPDHAACGGISVAKFGNHAAAISVIGAADRDSLFRAIRTAWKTSELAMGYRLIR